MLDTMVASKTNPDENYLQAIFEFGCKSRGSDRQSYPTVVAGGLNATKLHYESNNHPIKSNDLVLVDGGAQFGHYNSDVARTWPVSGKFTEAANDHPFSKRIPRFHNGEHLRKGQNNDPFVQKHRAIACRPLGW